MTSLHRKGVVVCVSLLVSLSSVALGQSVQTLARPVVRITQKVDNSASVALRGTHSPIVDRSTIGARLASSTPLSNLRLVLSPSDDQALALRTLMSEQQDNSSPNYHQWLTPDSFGQYFGVAPADVAAITTWLKSQGFTVESVSKGQRIISFRGTSGQVEAAFHTQMNHITVAGESHIANTTDLTFPKAIAPLVLGIDQLTDFLPKSGAAKLTSDFIAKDRSGATPMYTSTSSGNHYVAPGDAAIIYNSTPLLASGIDGTGVSIGVVARSDVYMADVQQFRSMFGLKKNDPTFTVIGSDPGLNTDDIEAYLDVEWAGAMAPGANVNFVVAGSDYYNSSGINASGLYLVDNNLTDIITMSYGGCESSNGSASTAFWNTLWEQAAAQGQSVFVSTGDSSAAGCQASNATYGTAYGVNALGSSAYNVAVGGSMFVDGAPSAASYWSLGIGAPVPANYTFATATGYIPEAAWNEGALSSTYLNGASTAFVAGSLIGGGGGGISACTARPAWQTGSGISSTTDAISPASGTGISPAISGCSQTLHRLVPDLVSIASGGHDATIICAEGVCQNTSTGYGIGAVGGTSVATPVMASVQALINQKNGGRQGNPNFYYYPLANADYTSGKQCYTSFGGGTSTVPVIGGTVTLPSSNCNFHDVAAGSNRVKQNSGDAAGLGFYSITGFDEASGLGSVNVNTIANNWHTVSLKATRTTFTLTPTTGAHGTSMALTVAVASASGTGTPTGDFSLIAVTTNPSSKLQYTLTAGAYTGTVTGLPGGSYNVYVNYAGDGTFGPSQSASIPVTISSENSTTTSTIAYIQGSGITSGPSIVPYGTDLLINTTIRPTSASTTVATGTVTYGISLNGTTIGSPTAPVDGLGNTSFLSGANAPTLFVASTWPALSPGVYIITASYSGDNTYNASSTTTSFTVTAIAPTATLSSSSNYITTGGSVSLSYSLARPSSAYQFPTASQPYPTGTVTFKDTTTSVTLGTATVNTFNGVGVATLTTTGITTTGGNVINALYSGDTNYATVNTNKTITVGTYTPTTTVASTTTGTVYVGSTIILTGTVTPSAATGTVYFFSNGNYLGGATIAGGVANYSTTILPGGTQTITASYYGTATYASSVGTTPLTVTPNVTGLTLDSPTFALYGKPVTFIGRITRSPSVGTPPTPGLTGTVSFMDGATVVATATPLYLPGGYAFYTATASISTLTRGQHTITATYSGDTNYASATSSVVTLSVGPADNVWIANGNGSVSALSASGAAYTGAALTGSGTAVAIDYTGDVWSLNAAASSLVEYSSGGATLSSGYAVGGINTPAALAIDGNGTIWVANGNSTVSAVSSAGAAVSPSSGYAVSTSAPTSVTIDASGNLWVTSSGDNSVTEMIGAAAPVATTAATAVLNNTVAARP